MLLFPLYFIEALSTLHHEACEQATGHDLDFYH